MKVEVGGGESREREVGSERLMKGRPGQGIVRSDGKLVYLFRKAKGGGRRRAVLKGGSGWVRWLRWLRWEEDGCRGQGLTQWVRRGGKEGVRDQELKRW